MNANIGQKIIGIFGTLLLLIGLSGFYQLEKLNELRAINETIVSHDIKSLHEIETLSTAMDAMAIFRAQLMVQRLLGKIGLPANEAGEFESQYRREYDASRKALMELTDDIATYARQATSAERGEVFQRMSGILRKIDGSLAAVGTETVENMFKVAAAGGGRGGDAGGGGG